MKLFRNPLVLSMMLLAAIALTVGVWGGARLFWRNPELDTSGQESAAREDDEVVELTPGKMEHAGIESAPVESRALREKRTIPGRLQYNQTRHIELRAPTDGTLMDVLVKPGDAIAAGTEVAVFSSPEIGLARAEVLRLEGQLELAKRKREWEQNIVTNAKALVEILEDEPDMTDVGKAFKSRTLGKVRETLLSAYTRYRLADQMFQGTASLRGSGAMSAKSLRERTAERQASQAAFRAAMEQVLFDSRNRFIEVDAEWKNAQRQLEIGHQKLTTLLGYKELTRIQETASPADSPEPISRVELRAPMAGTVERILFAANERVTQNDSLLVIADTSTLWVSAEIRDSDWAALEVSVGDELEVQTPALLGQSIKARVIFLGREVSEETHALPLMAEISNSKGRFRPGLFVRVNVPVSSPRDVLAVRPSSLMRHESGTFVFVEEGPTRYRRVDVTTGLETPEWIEIRRGLKEGKRVVEKGAFVLKSELLLEGEE